MKEVGCNIMFRVMALFLVFLMVGCSSLTSRRPIYETDISIRGGQFQDKEWEEKLKFKRVSWFKDATVTHEVLLTKLAADSKFANWLESDKKYLSQCSEFYVGIIYADINAAQGQSYLVSQLEKSNLKEVSILSFSSHIKAHQNFMDWKLIRHKVIGLCRTQASLSKMTINIPGFRVFEFN